MYVLVSGLEGLAHLRVYQDHRVGLLNSARMACRLSDTIFNIHGGGGLDSKKSCTRCTVGAKLL